MATNRTFHNHISMLLIFYLFFQNFHLSIDALRFNFSTFKGIKSGLIKFSGSALIINDSISLTSIRADLNLNNSTGRATYSKSMRLHDRAGGKMADFDTHFSFNISLFNMRDGGADGFAFFMVASNGWSEIPDQSYYKGGCLGLISNCSNTNSSSASGIFAVEFDTYHNDWDPDGDTHLGINVNSIKSVQTLKLDNTTMKSGYLGKARIIYKSETNNLSVSLTYPEHPAIRTFHLSHQVNLAQVLPECVAVGFSSATGNLNEVHYVLSWNFNSTEFPSKHPRGLGMVEAVGCSFMVVCVVTFSICMLSRRKWVRREISGRESKDDTMDLEFEHGSGPRRFSYVELVQATNNFAEQGKLGEGGFGRVYRGYLSALNSSIAVKRVSKASRQGRKEYMSEVTIISKLRHKNLVQLSGWCHEKGEFLLVYDLMPHGSLDSYLFQSQKLLSWELRYKIALGLASALLYLHEESGQCVVHRDIKSSNIMLDSNFNAKLADFGLATLMDQGLDLKTTGRIAGTIGYMAPEYTNSGQVGKESDVFSFGVVALEIACGRRSIEPTNERARISLVDWVWNSYENGSIVEVADKKLCMKFDIKEMECLMIVGLWCALPDYSLRPSIREALRVLNFEAPLPNIPRKMPVPECPNAPTSPSNNSAETLISNSIGVVGR